MIKKLDQLLTPSPDTGEWELRAVVHEDCVGYLAYNTKTREALWVDPKEETLEECASASAGLANYHWIAVIDTHVHADHISGAPALAEKLGIPYVMHEKSVSRRVDIRVCRDTAIPSHSGPVRLIATAGHTPDGLCAIWGPFFFTGDTVLFDDTGRDDLPGGDPEAHFETLQTLKRSASPKLIMLAGHDFRGGRADLWENQLRTNLSLTQNREDFVREAAAFDAPAPKQFKKSLSRNFR